MITVVRAFGFGPEFEVIKIDIFQRLGNLGYSRRRGQDLNSGRLRDSRRKLFSQGISVLPEGNSPYPSKSLRSVSMTQFPKYFQNDAISKNGILAVFGLFKYHGPMREEH